MHTFGSTEGTPAGPPVENKDFNLYGVAGIPDSNGTAYSFTVSTATFELLPNPIPGYPSGPLFAASDGFMYGATVNGGHPEAGLLFRMSTKGAIKRIYTYQDNGDGAHPSAPRDPRNKGWQPIRSHLCAGGFYTDAGDGTIFEVSLPSDNFGAVYSFNGAGGASTNPGTGLLSASDGNFYGTSSGGASNVGTIYEWQTGGSFLELFDFTGNGGIVSGANPRVPLLWKTPMACSMG